jgi:hypothetical protein
MSYLFWDVMPFSPLKVNGLHGFKYKKIKLFITIAVITSNPIEITLDLDI